MSKKTKASFSKSGFTIIELSLVVAIMTLVAGISVPVYQSFQVRNDLDVTILDSVNQFRRAQILAFSGAEDSAWGVHLSPGSIVVFKGSDFSLRDQAFDEELKIPNNISISGTTDVIFSKLSGEASFQGDITFTSINGDSKIFTLNQKGTIEY